MVMGSIHRENITILTVCVPKRELQIAWCKIEMKNDKSSIIFGDIKTPLSIDDRMSGQKISKNVEDSNNTINQFDLLDTYRILHPLTE